MESLAEVFDHHFQDVKFDNKFAVSIYKYHIHLSTMNSEHIQFFGQPLLGVNVLRYLPRDIRRFFDTVLKVDYNELEKDIRKLKTIYHENSISGDVMNLTLFYIIHRFYRTPHLDKGRQMRGAFDTALIFCYRCLFALNNNYFRHAVDPRVAQAAYANLSNKHLIKKLGSWKKLCDYRATRIVEDRRDDGESSLNYDDLYLFNDDQRITDIIQDSQNRFRSIINIYYDEFDKVHKDGQSIGTTSATIEDVDGDIVLREKTQGTDMLINYVRDLINDKYGFIDNDLVTVVADMNRNSSFRMIKSTLEWLGEAYHDPKYNKSVDKFVTDVVVQGMFYIEHNIPPSKRKDFPFILTTLKNLFLATRSTDPQLLSIRQQGEKLLKAAYKAMSDQKDKNAKAADREISESLMMSTRSAVILYIILRVLVGNRGR